MGRVVHFPDQPVIQSVGDGLYRVVDKYVIAYTYKGREYVDIIKPGTITDLASVPDGLLSAANDNGLIDGPAVWHDKAWEMGWHGYWGSNAIFWDLMTRVRIPLRRRLKYWLGVTNPIAFWNWREAQKRRKTHGTETEEGGKASAA